jgi:hypothetical protein
MPPPNATLVNLDFESYEMADPDHDGNWTVEIASINFTRHATGPALFRFLIDAREINGGVATPSMVSVEFTNGTTPTDNSAPYVFVERPLTEQVVYDQTVVNGTVTDDTCLSRIELWQEVTLLGEELWWPTQTIALAQESTSYFEFQLATANFTNGLSRVFLRAYDTSGNYHDQDVTFLVNHDSHDVAVTNIEIPEVTELGQLACLNVTVANYGSYQESFDLDLYLNMTLATTQAVNLTGGVASIVPMVWNTSDFDLNCYTISCYIRPVSDENNTDNNLYVTAPARALVRLVGDINQDSIVDILDAIIIAGSFSSQPGTPRWNPNADLNSDGIVDIYDAIALVNIYGKTA